MGILTGQTAVITGGSGGIASAAAKLLLEDGAAVVLMARRKQKLEEVREMLLAAVPHGHVEVHEGDATHASDLGSAFRKAKAIAGRLNILVATVGGATAMGPILTADMAAFRAEVELNLMTSVLALRHGAPLMQDGGSIIFISSTAGAHPFPLLSGYAAAKAALEHFAKTVADELAATGIRVNCVRAGMTRTNETEALFESPEVMAKFDGIVPLGRFGDPRDIGAAIRYLAGPESSWVTGHILTVDGGQMLRRNPDFS